MVRGSLLVRDRLVAVLARRWEHPVVELVAGPGFGKTVLLDQAMAENRLAPRGTDRVIRCTPAEEPSCFLARLAAVAGTGAALQVVDDRVADPQAIDGLDGREPTVGRVVAELARRWLLGVAVLIDDAHHLAATPGGRALLLELVEQAPAPVHVVLAGRTRLAGLARLRAEGAVLTLGERDLAFTDDEVAEAGGPAGIERLGGWPAAVALAARSGIVGALDYVVETVLERLSPTELRLLAVAACLGTVDSDLLRTAAGTNDFDPVALAGCVPLVALSPEGDLVVHDLWRPLAAGRLEPAERTGVVRRAVRLLVARGQFDRAFRLCAAEGDWDEAGVVLAATCRRGHAEIPVRVLERWLDLWPADRRATDDGLLLRGLVAREAQPFAPATAELLTEAVERYRRVGHQAGELAAGVALVYVLRNQGRVEALPALLARAVELEAEGYTDAAGPAAVARALFAEYLGDDEGMVAELERLTPGAVSPDWELVAQFRLAITHLVLGREAPMLAAAARGAHLAGAGPSRLVLALARWMAGEPAAALDQVDELLVEPGGAQGVTFGTLAVAALACAGRPAEAADRLAGFDGVGGQPGGPVIEGALVGARALVAAAAGDEATAARLLEEALATHPIDTAAGGRLTARWQPLAYVLVPGVRDVLDGSQSGRLHRRRLAAARLVVWAREGAACRPCTGGRRGAGRDRPGGAPAGGPVQVGVPVDGPARSGVPATVAALADGVTAGTLATCVPLPWAVLAAARLEAVGCGRGRELVAGLVEVLGPAARDALRDLADGGDRPLAAAARNLLGSLVLAPDRAVRIEVLGPAVLRLDGHPQDSPDWNRGRVRSLLLFLLLRGPSTREQIGDALWPDLDPEAAARNLRVTLSYLQRVLEPDRRSGESPWFVRQDGSRLTLAESAHLSTDLGDFRTALTRAEDADRRGLPSTALAHLEEALTLWRGEALADVRYEEWARPAIDQLTADHVAAALRAAELHLAAGRLGRARSRARAALAADEWCEPAHRILIAAALAAGDRAAASQALAACDAMLADLGVGPDPLTETLRRRLAPPSPARPLSRAA